MKFSHWFHPMNFHDPGLGCKWHDEFS